MNRCIVKVPKGTIVATPSSDMDYPGIYVEYLSDDDNGTSPSRPCVLMEKPTNEPLRLLIWTDSNSEDYTDSFEF